MCIKKNEFVPCRRCPNIKNGGPQAGYYYSNVEGYDVIKECACHKRWREDIMFEALMDSSGVKADYTFDNYVGTKSLLQLNCLKKVAEDPERFIYKKMIYMYGPNGCQKTSMGLALGKELLKKGYSVQYTLMHNLINCLVNDFSLNEENKTEKEYNISKFMDCDFLIVDEAFDLKKCTLYASGYQIPYLDSFLRNRFEIGKKSIIFISNVAPSDISAIPPSKPNEPPRQGFGTSIQNFVERNVRESTLRFNDVWIENCHKVNEMGLFS